MAASDALVRGVEDFVEMTRRRCCVYALHDPSELDRFTVDAHDYMDACGLNTIEFDANTLRTLVERTPRFMNAYRDMEVHSAVPSVDSDDGDDIHTPLPSIVIDCESGPLAGGEAVPSAHDVAAADVVQRVADDLDEALASGAYLRQCRASLSIFSVAVTVTYERTLHASVHATLARVFSAHESSVSVAHPRYVHYFQHEQRLGHTVTTFYFAFDCDPRSDISALYSSSISASHTH